MTMCPENNRRGRRSYGVTSLMTFVVVVAALVGQQTSRVRDQHALLELQELGYGLVEYSNPRSWYIPDWLESSLGEEYFRRPTGIRLVRLWNDESISIDIDEKIRRIARVKSLEKVQLFGQDIHDESLRCIGRLPNLRTLELSKTDISDSGLRYLVSTASLESLYLDETRVTDDGLVHLTRLTKLRQLDLTKTCVTASGIRKFRRANGASKTQHRRVSFNFDGDRVRPNS